MRLKVGLGILSVLLVLAILGPLFAQDPQAIDTTNRLMKPSVEHLCGTDTLGRDVLSRLCSGLRVSFVTGTLTVLLSASIGLILGILSTVNPYLDLILMKLCDGLKALPSTLLAILLLVILDGGLASLVIALSIVNIPQTSRLVRSRARVIKTRLFVLAERSIGASESRILFHTVLRHILPSLFVHSAFVFSSAIIGEASLSFIGAGLPAGYPSLGNMLSEGRSAIYQAPWLVLFPSLLVFLTSLGLNLVADGLEAK